MHRLFLLVFAACAIAFAQAPPPYAPGGPGGGGRGGGRGMPAPTNLKVLTPENYIGVMFGMQTALASGAISATIWTPAMRSQPK